MIASARPLADALTHIFNTLEKNTHALTQMQTHAGTHTHAHTRAQTLPHAQTQITAWTQPIPTPHAGQLQDRSRAGIELDYNKVQYTPSPINSPP